MAPLNEQDEVMIEYLCHDGFSANDIIRILGDHGSRTAVYLRVKRFKEHGSVFAGKGEPGRPRLIEPVVRDFLVDVLVKKGDLWLDELQYMILDEFGKWISIMVEHCFSFADHQSLAALSQTCAFTKDVAQPLLYRNVGVLGSERRSYRLQRLCQRMVEKHQLADRVRGITQSITNSFSVFRDDMVFDLKHWLTMSAKTRKLAKPIVSILSSDFFSEADLLLLLLFLCRNVRTLELTGRGTSRRLRCEDEFAAVLRYFQWMDIEGSDHSCPRHGSALSHEAGLYTVNELFISDESITANNVVPYLSLPGLRKLHLQSLIALPFSKLWEPRFRGSALKTIAIADCSATVIDIFNLLSAFEGLESLSIIWSTSQEAHRKPGWGMIQRGLKRHAETLHTLHLDYHVDLLPAADYGPYSDYVLRSIGTLGFMERLETLTIPKNALCMAAGEPLYIGGKSDSSTESDTENLASDDETSSDEDMDTDSVIEETLQDMEEDDPDMDGPIDDDGLRPCQLPESLKHLTVICEEDKLVRENLIAELHLTWTGQPEEVRVLNGTKTCELRLEGST